MAWMKRAGKVGDHEAGTVLRKCRLQLPDHWQIVVLKDAIFARNVADRAVEDHEIEVLPEQCVRRFVIQKGAVAAVEEPFAVPLILDHQMDRVFHRAMMRRVCVDLVVCRLDMAPCGRFNEFLPPKPIHGRVAVMVAVPMRVNDRVQSRSGEQCRASKGVYKLRQTRSRIDQ